MLLLKLLYSLARSRSGTVMNLRIDGLCRYCIPELPQYHGFGASVVIMSSSTI